MHKYDGKIYFFIIYQFNNQMIKKAIHPLRKYLYRYIFNHSYAFTAQGQKNSLITRINQLKNIEQFKQFYKTNYKQFNSVIFAITCTKISYMIKNTSPQYYQHFFKSLESNLFYKDFINQDYSNYNARELSEVFFLLRSIKLTNHFAKELSQLRLALQSKRIERLNKQPHSLKNLINLYYDMKIFKNFNVELNAKIIQLLKSEDQDHIEERQSISLLHVNLIFKALLVRNKLSREQSIMFNFCIKIIGNKISTIPINDIVQSICLINQIKNDNRIQKQQLEIIMKLKELILNNINKLQENSVIKIMKLNIIGEDNFFLEIYDKIIEKIFDKIKEDGTSQLYYKVIIQCLKHFSRKSKPISILKPIYLPKLFKFIQTNLNKGNYYASKYILRQFSGFVLSKFIPYIYKPQIEKFVIKNIQQPWSELAIYQLSAYGIPLQQYYQTSQLNREEQEEEEENNYKFFLRCISLKMQLQLKPQNKKIKQLLDKAEIQISKINLFELMKIPPKTIRIFHHYFSPIYIKNINLLPQQPQELKKILQYYIFAFNGRDIIFYLNKNSIQAYEASFLSFLKKFLSNGLQKLQPFMLFNILIIIQKILSKHQNLQQKKLIFLSINQFLCHNYLLVSLRPKFEYLTSLFYLVINKMVNKTKQLGPQMEKINARLIINLWHSTKLNKNTYYYLCFLKNIQKMKNIFPLYNQYSISNIYFQFGLITEETLFNRIQNVKANKSLQIFITNCNLVNNYLSMNNERMQQILNLCKDKHSIITAIIPLINNKNIKLLEGLLDQFIIDSPKLHKSKIFAINETLKIAKDRVRIYFHFLKNISTYAQNNFNRFYLFEHSYIMIHLGNSCPESYLQKFEDEFNKSNINRYYALQCLRMLLLLKNSLRTTTLLKIQFFNPSKLIFFTLLQENNLENVEQRLKFALQKIIENPQAVLDSLICQYIAKKYPALKQIQSVKKVSRLIILKQKKVTDILNSLQKMEEVKISQKKAAEHTYYQINNIKIIFTNGLIFLKMVKEVYGIDPIVININSSQSSNVSFINRKLGLSPQKIEQQVEEIYPIEETQSLIQDYDQTQTIIDQ